MPFSIAVNFNGNCREAVTFYAEVFGQETPLFLTYGETDVSFAPNVAVSEEMLNKIMSAQLNISGTLVEFSDIPDNFHFIRGNHIVLSVSYDSPDEAAQVFDRLKLNGAVFVPFAEISGQGYYGMVGDQFGLTWTVIA